MSATAKPGPITFDVAFAQFTDAMRLKFIARHDKQHARGFKSVLDPGFTEDDLDPAHIGSHFREEVDELLAAKEEERPGEAVDVSNMSLLIWWKWRPKA